MGDEHVIPQFVRKIGDAARVQKIRLGSGGKVRVEIQGDGSETRSFCHVDDFVDGLFVATERGGNGEIFHIGTEEEVSILAVLQAVGHHLGVSVEAIPGARTQGSTPRRCPSIAKLRALGYAPAITLDEGLGPTVAWYRAAYAF